MKILIINVNSHEGSVGKIAHGLLNFLTNRGDQALLACNGPRESDTSDPRIIKLNNKVSFFTSAILTKFIGYEGIYNKFATDKLIETIKKFKPDVVQLYNLHGYWIDHFRVLKFLKEHNINTVYSMLDEFPYLGICFFVSYPDYCQKYKTECKKCPHPHGYNRSIFFDHSYTVFKRKQKLYKDFKNLIFTGPPFVVKRAKESVLTMENIIIPLDEPINFENIFFPRDTRSLRDSLNIPQGNKVIVTVANDKYPRKGGPCFIEIANRLQDKKNITFVFVGCRQDRTNLPSNVIPISFVKSQDLLAEYYSLGDLFVCCSLADTTPNTCLEAMGCGTPIAGFREGGIPYCADESIGTYVNTLDTKALANIIVKYPLKTKARSEEVRNYALGKFSFNVIYKKQYHIYESLIKQHHDTI